MPDIGATLSEIGELMGVAIPETKSVDYAWFVGASNSDGDCSEKMIAENRWENMWDDRFLDLVKQIKVGDRIALKAAYTKKKDLPFNSNGKTVAVMGIKAIGVVTKNLNDGKNIEVNWTKLDSTKEWYGLETLRQTIHLVKGSDGTLKNQLLEFTFSNKPQDYSVCEEHYADDIDGGEIPAPSNDKVQKGFNRIYYGVPGSGKSYEIDNITKAHKDKTVRVVFHPDYTYSDFVGQVMPRVDGEKVKYVFTPGPFTRILRKAYKDPYNMYYLVIEEINRGNAPAIFGELFQLLDRIYVERVENEDTVYAESGTTLLGTSCYTITNYDIADYMYKDEIKDDEARKEKEIGLPANLTIFATMNTSDQNVFTLDTAFQRRWFMSYVPNKFDGDNMKHSAEKIGNDIINWGAFATIVNIIMKKNPTGYSSTEDKSLGAYFATSADLTKNRFAEKVLKYLWDDAFKYDRSPVFENSITSFGDLIEKYIATNVNSLKAVLKPEVYQDMVDACPNFIYVEEEEDDSGSPKTGKKYLANSGEWCDITTFNDVTKEEMQTCLNYFEDNSVKLNFGEYSLMIPFATRLGNVGRLYLERSGKGNLYMKYLEKQRNQLGISEEKVNVMLEQFKPFLAPMAEQNNVPYENKDGYYYFSFRTLVDNKEAIVKIFKDFEASV